MTTDMTRMQASLLTMFAQFLASGLFHKFCMALVILVVGVLAIRIIGKILGKTLEKSKLEKAAHTLINSLAKTALYILLGALLYLALSIFLGSVVSLGYARFNLNLMDGRTADYGDLFGYFPHWKNAVLAGLLKSVTITVGFLLLIVPGVLASYNFAMSDYLLSENPELSPREALSRSRFLMRGNRWRLFCLEFSFIGWELLSSLVWGIGSLWINPYKQASRAAFYREISDTWVSQAAFAEPVSDPETVG